MKSVYSETNENNELVKTIHSVEPLQFEKKKRGRLALTELPETNELEIQKEATETRPAKRIRFPRERWRRFAQKPDKFKQTQNAFDEWSEQCRRERAVYATSLESCVGYSSLFRTMRTFLSDRVLYYRSEEGGALSFEEAIERVFGAELKDEAALKDLFERVMTMPVDSITFLHLSELSRDSAATAENVWEWIKREASHEFKSGHLAADSLEPLGRTKEAWTRAKYVAIRESFCAEYKPQGAIELSMIDLLVQSWFMVQFWTKEMSQRMMTEPHRFPSEYLKQKEWKKKANPRTWEEKKWDWEIPSISESQAIEQAAQMLDRFQKMYFRALRQLRDWRRYSPPVTINNPRQVNIATEGGQQINVSGENEDKKETNKIKP